MECFLVVVLAFAGLCHGLQSPLHYQYEYTGSVMSGIPEINTQASGWAMKATVQVYTQKDTDVAIFQLQHVLMAEFTGLRDCDFRGDIPVDLFLPIEDPELMHALESPFRVHLFHHEDFAIEYFDDEYLWLPNMRKGIAAMFKNEILQGNINDQVQGSVAAGIHEGKVLNIFSVNEDTMFGNCRVDYTIYPIPTEMRGNRGITSLDQDVQRPKSSPLNKHPSKTSKKSRGKTTKSSKSSKSSKTASKYRKDVPHLDEGLWHVVRSVDFDHCQERVEAQNTPLMFHGKAGGSQYQWVRSRSSVAEYIFRGSPGNLRLERAIVEGATAMAPMGIATEVIQSRINQTLHLVSVTSGGTVPTPSGKLKQAKSWMYEVLSPFDPPKESKPHPWVIYTGEGIKMRNFQSLGVAPFTPQEYEKIKESIIYFIEKASLRMTDLDQEEEEATAYNAPSLLLEKASALFLHLNKDQVKQVFHTLFDKDLLLNDLLAKKLIVDAAAASGNFMAYSAILDYIKEGKIPNLQVMTFFMGLTNNAKCPLIIPEMAEYVVSLDMKENPFLASTVIINFAEFAKRFCVSPSSRDVVYPGAGFGDSGCDKKVINEIFLPFLKDIIYSEDTTWEKNVAIQSLKTLGTPFSFPILAPVVEGKVKCTNKIRRSAIYALEKWHLMEHQHLQKQILDLLSDVYSDIGEHSDVRIAALSATSTWATEPSFWHRLAITSWREPSKQFAAFTTSLIQSFANFHHSEFIKQNQAATYALKFAKPITPSIKYSYINMWTSGLVDKHFSKFETVYWLSNDVAFNPKEFYYFLMSDLGGLPIITLEVYATMKDVINILKQRLREESFSGSAAGIAARIAADFYDDVQDTIHSETLHHQSFMETDIMLRMFDSMHLLLPVNDETSKKVDYFDKQKLVEFVIQLGLGYDSVLGKFTNPVSLNSVHPTELGLPLIVNTNTPIAFSVTSYSKVAIGGTSISLESLSKVEFSTEILGSISSAAHSSINVLLPWNGRMVGTFVRSTRDVTFPLKVVVRTEKREAESGHEDIVRVDLQNQYKKKFTVVSASNTPFTIITPIIQLKDTPPVKHFLLVAKTEPNYVKYPLPNKFTGLSSTFHWLSEMGLPFSMVNLRQVASECSSLAGTPFFTYVLASPTIRFWDAKFEFDPEASKTKNITFEFVIGEFGKTLYTDDGQTTGQSTGQTNDYDYSQMGQEGGVEQYDQTPNVESEFEFGGTGGFQEIGNTQEAEVVLFKKDDTIEQRSQKILGYFGGLSHSKSLKVDFGGEEHRTYEVNYSYAHSKKNDERKLKKSQVTVTRSALPGFDNEGASMCLDTQISSPVFSELDTLETLLEANLNKEIRAELFLGCKGKPILTAKSSYHLSESWKHKLESDLVTSCDFDQYDPLSIFHRQAVYDELKFTLTWEKLCDSKKYPLTTSLINLAELAMDARFLKGACAPADQERKLQVNVHRCSKSENWFVNAKRQDAELSLDEIPHSDLFDCAFSIGKREMDGVFEKLSSSNLKTDKCSVGLQTIRTFDGFTYDYASSPCWTVAAKDCYTERGWVLLVRSPRGESTIPEARFIDVNRGLVVEYVNNRIIVNGKQVDPFGEQESIKDDEGKVMVIIHKKNDFFMVQLSHNFYITLKNQIQVHVPEDMYGQMCGLCGDYNGEPEGELVGPHRCFYEDSKLFVSSWASKSDTCGLYTLLELRENAENYQKTCTTIESLHEKCPHFNSRCFKYEFMVVKEEDKLCSSVDPLPHCEDGCESYEYTPSLISFKCWPSSAAPGVIKAALANGETYITTPIATEAYYTDVHRNIQLPTACKHY